MDTLVSEEEMTMFRQYMADPAARAAFVEFKAEAAENGTARRYEHVLRAVASRPWAIHEPVLAVIVDVLAFRAFGGRLTAEEIQGRIGAARRTSSTESPRGVARIPISGVIMPKAGGFDDISGGTSAEAVAKAIRSAANSPDVTSIVLDIDSPGGSVEGIPELAALIADVNQIKPVTAVANHEANSAAFWLASQAGRIIAAPSARVGSIGVITAHEEDSIRAEREGIRTTVVSAGKFKGEGSPFGPLSDEAKAHMQSMVDEYYGMFVEGVARGRGVKAAAVSGGFGEGRVVTASNALKMGMIDGIGTIDEVIADELNGPVTRAGGAAARAHLSVVADSEAAPVLAAGPAVEPVTTGPEASEEPIVINVNGSNDPEVLAAAVKAELDKPKGSDDEAPSVLAAQAALAAVVNGDEPAEADPAVQAAVDKIDAQLKQAADPTAIVEDPNPESETLLRTPQMMEIERLTKALHDDEAGTEPETDRRTAPDTSAWDTHTALVECSTASEFRLISAAEREVGGPDEPKHWALPHHYLGYGPNVQGVAHALSVVDTIEDPSTREKARAHLQAHQDAITGNDTRSEAQIEEFEAIQAQLAVLAGLPE